MLPDNLKDAILSHVGGRTEILGSQLGYFIRRTAPDWSLKDDYGSLREFVESELSDVLIHVGKQGGDDIYRMHRADEPGLARLTGDDRTLWSLFNNPQREGRIFVRPDGLWVVRNGSAAPDDGRELVRIAEEEYRTLLVSLAEQIPIDLRDRFSEILSSSDKTPWSEVLNLLRKSGYSRVGKELERKRIEYVFSEFRRRLGGLGLTPQQIDDHEATLNASNGRGHLSDRNTRTHLQSVLSVDSRYPTDEKLLREIAKKAIDEMSAEQIRQLNLPLGHVWDALLVSR
ncbi:hypothetical protein [Burkholderia glumae]|uniref:Uncharacterized protein n=1 Tax=Burkholderia glumae TaxID=337 RepID=A0AAP9Y622_BURGL|nr:hypothetical protein [Burkholderia glumae]AJY62460.1 hypothetical protein KS03_5632 [Burkholderia glumae LMG 2196 = ATCC 33617]PNL04037.1 hypothetical protein CEQ24_011705 [Burkholderia glumae]QPQ94863.1 hypothetical protein I6H06_29350 [Burkholderia glumae]QQM89240.1 hypothetical protein I6G78_00385 [Burkholderia glumae]UVT05745.1 hypothetical protein EFP20_29685 [Burkholderia glumae]